MPPTPPHIYAFCVTLSRTSNHRRWQRSVREQFVQIANHIVAKALETPSAPRSSQSAPGIYCAHRIAHTASCAAPCVFPASPQESLDVKLGDCPEALAI